MVASFKVKYIYINNSCAVKVLLEIILNNTNFQITLETREHVSEDFQHVLEKEDT